MGNSIKPHIQNAGKTGVCQLANSNLKEFPRELYLIEGILRTLDLSGNKIGSIPSAIAKFEQLKHLTLTNNRISSLPDSMCKLKKLESLLLGVNQLSRLPETLSQLGNLKTVVLSENRLTSFPRCFCGLKHLDVLDLSRNRIAEVPDCVGDLQATELNLNQNQISLLSENVANCPRLKVLRLEENCLQISSIPTSLLADSQVSLLAVEGNLFELKDLQEKEGYEAYMERYTATKKKMY
ncbi:leucine-rich repeat-containing protein 57 [Ixodes scapularis]|uniref:Leucine rich domain-containing protein, putative n=1 Tax=Ixodes scapularis TaxID=6945 RepID=B7QG97_IXOSC|nr:leucine-rich repeat-containing protein 57 [Ixodes scapularis]EEC17869.1 leucine rich domain-containing protein, putative [Ixodes scapularis]|eukprot:XP_002401355.1 leucine rich domain-containing protein, putative [Ixodes scapularis]